MEARGHEVVKRAIRTGQEVAARTPSEVRALGLAAAQGRLPEALGGVVAKKVVQAAPVQKKASTASGPKATAKASPKSAAVEQIRAGVSGAVDEFSLGAADRVLSAGDALLDGGVQGFGDRYAAGMGRRRAEDAYDSQHYGAARTTGRVVGLAGGLAATGGAAAAGRAALSGVPRAAKLMAHVAKAPRLKIGVDPHGLVRFAAGGGAAAGVGAQVVEDVVAGRASSLGQYGAATLAGAVGGVATLRHGPMHGGAIGGASDAIASDIAAGRSPSVEGAIGSAHAGAVLGKAGDLIGTYGTAALPAHLKGNVGEGLSVGKTLSRGKVPKLKKTRVPVGVGERYSIPDQRIGRDFLEAKMGPSANLSPNQRLLQAKTKREGNKYLIDAWQFRDAGKAAGVVGAPIRSIWADEERTPWRGR